LCRRLPKWRPTVDQKPALTPVEGERSPRFSCSRQLWAVELLRAFVAVPLPLIISVRCGELILKIFDPWITALKRMLVLSLDAAPARYCCDIAAILLIASREVLGKTRASLDRDKPQLSLTLHPCQLRRRYDPRQMVPITNRGFGLDTLNRFYVIGRKGTDPSVKRYT
jgi:hypothetical protein